MNIILGIVALIVVLIIGSALFSLLDDILSGCGCGCGCLLLILLIAFSSCFTIIWFL